ncbi:MAG: replicative DNA helicase [Desulfacinum sp.]|jgi:replicative DNA helicase|nr:replicative DNA helicase [Desulfacinum sp.]MBZ4658609.1 dnaB [Desulfacinum sp.]
MEALADELRRVPPHQIEAEQSLIGGMLLDNSGLPAAMELLKGDEFYREAHRIIFRAMQDLFERNEPVDLITVTDLLQQRQELEAVGGAAYLASLTQLVPSAANVPTYAKIVSEKAILRRLIQVAGEISSWCYGAGKNAEEVLDRAESAIFAITENRIRNSYAPIKDVVKESIRTIESLQERRELVTGVPTHFRDLDKITSGLQPSDLIIIAGRPSMGKTAFALNIARNAAMKSGIPCAVFSLEMSKEQLAMRLLCSEARVDSQKVRTGFLSQQDCAKLLTAAGYFMEAPLFIDDTPAITTLELRAKARRLKMEHGIGMIMVDYLQLMRSREHSERRELEISDISRSLKALAKELNVPVVALSQLNRKVEERHDKRPQLSDLRESGAIEQDADVIAFIYRDEVYNPESKDKGTAEIIVSKQRNGPTGRVKLAYINSYTRFEDLAPEEGTLADPA